MTPTRRLTAEFLGTALLLAAVVGSGIMGDRLSGGNVAIALLANTIATGATLMTLILTFGPVSGAHFNPAVTLADASQGGISWREAPGYIAAQVVGALVGVWAAHLMFGEPVELLHGSLLFDLISFLHSDSLLFLGRKSTVGLLWPPV